MNSYNNVFFKPSNNLGMQLILSILLGPIGLIYTSVFAGAVLTILQIVIPLMLVPVHSISHALAVVASSMPALSILQGPLSQILGAAINESAGNMVNYFGLYFWVVSLILVLLSNINYKE